MAGLLREESEEDSEAWRLGTSFRRLAKQATENRGEDRSSGLVGSVQLRLAITYGEALRNTDLGYAYRPRLMWNRFFENRQDDAQEFVSKIVSERLEGESSERCSPRLHVLFVGSNSPNLILSLIHI